MADTKVQKIKLLKIWEILSWKSDEQHPLSTQDIISELKQLGIKCDRRTVYSDIDAMQSNGYSIMNRRRGHDMMYWVQQRQFSPPELKIIMDAIQSSKFIPQEKTTELMEKIASLGGSEAAHLLLRNAVRFNTVKLSNEDIFDITDKLEQAIENSKRVSFRYFDINAAGDRVYRHDNKLYEEEPLAMLCSEGNYYLICYRPEPEYDNHVKIFRVFKMYGGQMRKVRLAFDESLIGVVYNKYGEEINIRKSGSRYTVSVEIQISPTFWGWLMQFPTQMEIISPVDVREQFSAWILSAAEKYQIQEPKEIG